MSSFRDVRDIATLSPDEIFLERLRHSAAHVMAQAVRRAWPGTKLAIGPTVEHGFYYDMDVPQTITPEHLEAIEAEMRKIAKEDLPLVREEWDKATARAFFAEAPFKLEIIEGIPDATVSVYRQGEFTDLCQGPHLDRTSQLEHFKLTTLAAAYWRGDERNPQLTRIYGIAFASASELEAHVKRLEEAKARDHRKLGKELGLFSFHPEAPAMPFFHPKGAILYNALQAYVRGMYPAEGYQEVITPQIFDTSLWKTSGHYDNYIENLFLVDVDEREFGVKPMNCPAHCLMFSEGKWSYRDLPLRFADFGRLHRYERSGVTSGLTRVRSFCQDDAHIFCTPEQIGAEIQAVIAMTKRVYADLGLGAPRVTLSTRPDKAMGDAALWTNAEAALERVLVESGLPWSLDAGGGAFYGPKIDFFFEDAIGRSWQLGTIQLDFNLPEAFDLAYTTSEDARARPVIVHRAVLGSIERFMGVYIEHCAGSFPPWLSPVQARVMSITDDVADAARAIVARLSAAGLRAELDERSEKVGKKIRDAQLGRIPWMLVVGKREAAEGKVAVRLLRGGDRGALSVEDFLRIAAENIRTRALTEDVGMPEAPAKA